MVYIGVAVIILGLILMGGSPGPAFLLLVVGLALDVIGLIRYIKRPKPKKKVVSRHAPTLEPPNQEPEPKPQKTTWISQRIGTAGLKYHYENVPIMVTDATTIMSAAEKEAWDLKAVLDEDVVKLYAVDGEIGYLDRFAGMVGDWIRRKEPFRILLQRYNEETGKAVAFLAFYKEGYNPDDEEVELVEDDDE